MILATCLALLTVCPGWLAVDNEYGLSEEGSEFLKEVEEFVPFAYYDGIYPPEPAQPGDPVNGTLTIGYGHTAAPGTYDFKVGDTITEEEALEVFIMDVTQNEEFVKNRMQEYGVVLTPREFDYMVSATFNRGAGTIKGAYLYRSLANGDYDIVNDIMLDMVDSDGEINRVNKEYNFLTTEGEVTPTTTTTMPPPTTTSTTSTTMPTTTATQPQQDDGEYVDVMPYREAMSRKAQQEAMGQKRYIQQDLDDLVETWKTLVGQYFGVIPGGPKPKGNFGFIGDKIAEIMRND